MEQERSAGGVVYRREDGAVRIQMIRDRYGKMTLAKGKMEPGETVEQTALREILEETGIRGRIVAPLETVRYTYERTDSGIIDKEVHYFLVEALNRDLTAQVEEIASVGWFEPREAWRRQREAGYTNNDSVLKKAFDLLGLGGTDA